jgi:hypothetical protein
MAGLVRPAMHFPVDESSNRFSHRPKRNPELKQIRTDSELLVFLSSEPRHAADHHALDGTLCSRGSGALAVH